MTVASLVLFATALLLAAGTPGPSIAALVARVLARGWRDVAPFITAMWVGEAIWLTMAIAGLAVIAETFQTAFLIVKYAGAAYLLWLAWRMWFTPADAGDGTDIPRRGGSLRMFLAGLTVTLGNPKIMVFYLALLPAIVDLATIGLVDWALLCLTMLVVLAAVDLAYVGLAAKARGLLRSPRAVRIANRISATAMGGAAVAIATR